MKTTQNTASNNPASGKSPGLARKLLCSLAIAVGFASSASAAIAVGDSGSGINAFDATPAATEWSTLSWTGALADITDAATMDTAVAELTAASISTTLGTSGTTPPSANVLARRNTALNLLQIEPRDAATKGCLLMATLQNTNTSGNDVTKLQIAYDFGRYDDVAEELEGVRVYYSMTGQAGSWTAIPDLCTATAGSLSTVVTLDTRWAPGAKMYVLWADDNASNATDDTNTIDNISFTINEAPPSANVLSFDFGTYGAATIDGTNISIQVLAPDLTLAPTYTLSTGATCDVASGFSQNFSSPVLFTVKSSDESVTKVYTVTVLGHPMITTRGDTKKVAVFNLVGTHSWTVPAGVSEVEVLVVGGGGGAGNNTGGGGAGGLYSTHAFPVTAGASVAVTIGAGGAGGAAGSAGLDSVFGSVTAYGGGAGIGTSDADSAGASGANNQGGSGFAGGTARGGAGGAGQAGQNGWYSAPNNNGGNGVSDDITGPATDYGGGGSSFYNGSHGGLGGGGSTTDDNHGGTSNPNGVNGLGGGAAAGRNINGGNGGSGVVIVAYAAAGPSYTVSFESNAGSTVDPQIVVSGAKATVPTPAPTKAGYLLAEWCSDAGLTSAFDFNTPITGDTTLYAKWVTAYTVTFQSNAGSAVSPQTVATGGKATEPTPAPTKDGFTFLKWYSDETLTTEFVFATEVISGDITLYARWLTNYTVTFNTDGGSSVDPQTVAYGFTPTRPANPTKTGFTFINWYQVDLETLYNFDDSIVADTQVYAKWSQDWTVTFESNGGSSVAIQYVTSGGKATEPTPAPTKADCVFLGWYADSGLTSPFDFNSSIGADTSIYAKWLSTYFYVGGNATIGQSTLTATNGKASLPAAGAYWSCKGQVEADGLDAHFTNLASPTMTVANNGEVILTLKHAYSFADSPAYDGAAVIISVDGGLPTYVPKSAFTSGAYNSTAASQLAFAGGLDCWAGGNLSTVVTSVANLGTYTAGQTIAVTFVGAWDSNWTGGGTETQWEIRTVQVSNGASQLLNVDFFGGPAGFTVSNTPTTIEGPWTYNNAITTQFEINATTPLTSDSFVADTAGTVIDLSNAKLKVVLVDGTLSSGMTFTLFDLTNGSTLAGTYNSIELPQVYWDLSGLEPGGNGKITALSDPYLIYTWNKPTAVGTYNWETTNWTCSPADPAPASAWPDGAGTVVVCNTQAGNNIWNIASSTTTIGSLHFGGDVGAVHNLNGAGGTLVFDNGPFNASLTRGTDVNTTTGAAISVASIRLDSTLDVNITSHITSQISISSAISGTGGLNIIEAWGDNTWAGLQLSGTNTYTGDTVINVGANTTRMTLTGTGSLAFKITDAGSNKVTGTGTAALNGSFSIDTSAVTVSGGTWTLVDVATPVYGSSFSVTGYTKSGSVWLNTDARGDWSFDPATGVLTLIPPPPAMIMALSYELGGVTYDGVIDHDLKKITLGPLPAGSDLSLVAPVYTLSSGDCDRASGAVPTPDNFAVHNSLVYTVTDGGTVNEYTVTVTVAPAPFTPIAYPYLQPIAVTALNDWNDRTPIKCINGSGMTPSSPVTGDSTCSADASTMYMSPGNVQTWITFDLGSVQTINGFRLWNYNESGYPGRGVKDAQIYVGTSMPANGTAYGSMGPNWAGGTLVDSYTFTQATGANGCPGVDYAFTAPVTGRYIQMFVTSNMGTQDTYTGISEIRFMQDVPPHQAGMLTFGLPPVMPGTLDGAAITLHVPVGADVTNLAPVFTMTEGATCYQTDPRLGSATVINSGDAFNFTNPVHYWVQSSDGLITNDYIVTASEYSHGGSYTWVKATAPGTYDWESFNWDNPGWPDAASAAVTCNNQGGANTWTLTSPTITIGTLSLGGDTGAQHYINGASSTLIFDNGASNASLYRANVGTTTPGAISVAAITLNSTLDIDLPYAFVSPFTISSPISGPGGLNIISAQGNFPAEGWFGLNLTGANTYTGDTTFGSAAYVNVTGSLSFKVTDTGNNKLTGTGTVNLNGPININTSEVTSYGGTWTLVDVGTLKEYYGSSFSVTGFTKSGTAWSKTDLRGVWSFDEATGVLTLVPPPPALILALSYEIGGVTYDAVVDNALMKITLGPLPQGTDLATVAPTYVLSSGICDQLSGSTPDPTFAVQNPATYTVQDGEVTNVYEVSVLEYVPEPYIWVKATTVGTYDWESENWNLPGYPNASRTAVTCNTQAGQSYWNITQPTITIGSLHLGGDYATAHTINGASSTLVFDNGPSNATLSRGTDIGTTAGALINVSAMTLNSTLDVNITSHLTSAVTIRSAIGGTGGLNVLRSDGDATWSGLQLSGLNTYIGDTVISAPAQVTLTTTTPDSTLGTLTFKVTDTGNNKITGAGTIYLKGAFNIDTSAVTIPVGTWTLVDVGTLTEYFGSTFTVNGFTKESTTVWKKVDGEKIWYFDTSTGVLTNPAAWITDFRWGSYVGVIDQNAKTISLTVPNLTVLANLNPTYTLYSGTCDQSSGSVPTPTFAEANPVTYTVYDNSVDVTRAYAVTVTVAELATGKSMSDPYFAGLGYAYPTNAEGTDFVLRVKSGTPISALSPTFTLSFAATCDYPSGTERDFSAGTLTYRVTAEDTSSQDYTVTVAYYTGYEERVMASNPLDYWSLNEGKGLVAYDNIGGDIGSYSSTGITYNVAGPKGEEGVSFNGQYGIAMRAPNIASVHPNTAFSVELWAKPAALNSGTTTIASNMRVSGDREGWIIYQDGANFSVRLFKKEGTATSCVLLSPCDTIRWYHLVLTWDDVTGTARFYKDGILAATSASGLTYYGSTHPDAMMVGARSDSNFPWSGSAAHFAFYNRELAGSEVANHVGAIMTVAQGATSIPDKGSQDFGSGLQGVAKPLTFTINNPGSEDLTGLVITKDGANADDFEVTQSPTPPVAPSGSTTFEVTFTPKASGTRNAAIHISNNWTGSFTINLSGTGLDDAYTAWAATNGIPAGQDGVTADPDGDNSNNLSEFGFGGDPLSGSDNPKVFSQARELEPGKGKELIITVAVLNDVANAVFTQVEGTGSLTATSPSGITYTIECSDNLAFPGGGVGFQVSNYMEGGLVGNLATTEMNAVLASSKNGAQYSYRSFILTGSAGLPTKGFLRAVVTK